MWLWECELNQIGFRQRSPGYWQCERGFGLPKYGYVSVFVGGKGGATRSGQACQRPVEISAFHVTFKLGVDNLHFYYHEQAEGVWDPGGHTSTAEIRRYQVEPSLLRQLAAAWQGVLLARW